MKWISIALAALIAMSALSARAGSILKEAGDTRFVLSSYTHEGESRDVKNLKTVKVNIKHGMILFRDGDFEFLTACKGQFSNGILSNTLVGLTCVTLNGRTRVTYATIN